jgi:HSP20 family protein
MTAMRTMGLTPIRPPEATVDEFQDEYVVHLAVPGFALEELEVEVAGRLVTVSGDQAQTAVDHGPFRLHERREDCFELPGDADPERMKVLYAHGALELHAPRRPPRSRRPQAIPIERRVGVNPDASGV